jgi:hypothetical protein
MRKDIKTKEIPPVIETFITWTDHFIQVIRTKDGKVSIDIESYKPTGKRE